jgi:thiol-disulfide isomerase/thioredoxin
MEPDPPAATTEPASASAPEARAGAPKPLGRAARLALTIVAAAAAIALFWPRSPAAKSPGGYLVDRAGKPVELASELAPVTLLHFWATWCPPCMTELPELVEYARATDGAGQRVLLVAVGDDAAAARRFLAADDLELLYDPAWEVAHRYRTRQLPETHVLIGGKVVHSFIGAQSWRDPAVRAKVSELAQKWTASPTSPEP